MTTSLLLLVSVLAAAECWRPMVSRDPMRDPTVEYKPPIQPWENQEPSARLRPPTQAAQTSWGGGTSSPQSRTSVHHHYARPSSQKFHYPFYQHQQASTAYHLNHPLHYPSLYHHNLDQTPLPSNTLHLQVVTPQETTTSTTSPPPTSTSYRPPPAVVMEGHSKVKKYGPVEGSVNSVFLQSGKFPLYPVINKS